MPQWGNTDDAANSANWAVARFGVTANTANKTALFGNTTADSFVTGQTIGTYGVSAQEVTAARVSDLAKPAHAGHVLRIEGSGGRAGRITNEVLVASGSLTGDAENTAFAEVGIKITSNPQPASGSAGGDDIVTFSVAATVTPSGNTITYVWQANTGAGFANVSNAGAYSNSTTVTMSVLANTATDGDQYRALVISAGAASKLSNSAVITITA
jgi:hypothetical protein